MKRIRNVHLPFWILNILNRMVGSELGAQKYLECSRACIISLQNIRKFIKILRILLPLKLEF